MKFLFTSILLTLFTQALGLEFLQDTVIETSYWKEYCDERCGGTFQVGKNGGVPAIIDSILLGKTNIPEEVEGFEIRLINESGGWGGARFIYSKKEKNLKIYHIINYTHVGLYDYKTLYVNHCYNCDFNKCYDDERKPVEIGFEAIFVYREGEVKRDTVVFIGLTCTGKYRINVDVLRFERESRKKESENFNAKGQVLDIQRNNRKPVFTKILK